MREAPPTGRWHPDEDALVEVCLGHADPRAQEEITVHLAGCASCRASYADLADAVESVLAVVPRIAPPPGFEDGVLRALDAQPQGASGGAGDNQTTRSVGMGASGGAGGNQTTRSVGRVAADNGAEDDQTTRPVSRRTILWAAAAAAGLLGAAAGAGATAYLGRDREPTPDPWAVPLLTGDGEEVGTVLTGYDDRGPVLVIAVDEGEAGLAVTCLLELSDGGVEDVGRWELSDERANSWVVPLEYDVVRVDLMTDAGVWASAAL